MKAVALIQLESLHPPHVTPRDGLRTIGSNATKVFNLCFVTERLVELRQPQLLRPSCILLLKLAVAARSRVTGFCQVKVHCIHQQHVCQKRLELLGRGGGEEVEIPTGDLLQHLTLAIRMVVSPHAHFRIVVPLILW